MSLSTFVGGLYESLYLSLPKPYLFCRVPLINPIMEFIGALQKSRFWWVKVVFMCCLLQGLIKELSLRYLSRDMK